MRPHDANRLSWPTRACRSFHQGLELPGVNSANIAIQGYEVALVEKRRANATLSMGEINPQPRAGDKANLPELPRNDGRMRRATAGGREYASRPRHAFDIGRHRFLPRENSRVFASDARLTASESRAITPLATPMPATSAVARGWDAA